jgi:hypothetical protein
MPCRLVTKPLRGLFFTLSQDNLLTDISYSNSNYLANNGTPLEGKMESYFEIGNGYHLKVSTSKHSGELVSSATRVKFTDENGFHGMTWMPFSDYSRRVIVTPCPRVSAKRIAEQHAQVSALCRDLILECQAFHNRTPGTTFAYQQLI